MQPRLPEVAFLGRSNVGKSSLINALLRRKALARTSKTPGKTRDCNVYRVDDALYLVDLPGYGYAKVSKGERRRFAGLIDRYLATREALRGAVWLLDIRRDPSDEDGRIAQHLVRHEVPTLVALTKGDKFGRTRQAERKQRIIEALGLPDEQAIVTSAVTRAGIEDLRASVMALVDGESNGP